MYIYDIAGTAVHTLYQLLKAFILLLRNLCVKWIYKPIYNWVNPSPYREPISPTDFFLLLEAKNVEGVKAVLPAGWNQHGAAIDPRDLKGNTGGRRLPLTVAVNTGSVAMTELLVRHGANPFRHLPNQKTPIELAISRNKCQLVESMMRLSVGQAPPGAKIKNSVRQVMSSALYESVLRDNVATCRLLLQYGADPFRNVPVSPWQVFLQGALDSSHGRNQLQDWRDDPNAYWAAVKQGNIHIVRYAVLKGYRSQYLPRSEFNINVYIRLTLVEIL